MIVELILTAATTCFLSHVTQFDKYINANYLKLRSTAEQICWNDPSYEDILNNNLVKVRDRITKSGWTSTTYAKSGYERSIYSFIWRAIKNDYNLKKKRDNKRPVLELEVDSSEVLSVLEGQSHDSQSYQENLQLFSKSLFKYLDRNYDDKKALLFKTYFLTSANTYKKLAEQSQLKEHYIRQTISRMKKDVRLNLESFVEDQKIQEVWRPVKNYEGLYEISNKKRLKNRFGLVLKPDYKDHLYGLWRGAKRKYKTIDQLMAGSFGIVI